LDARGEVSLLGRRGTVVKIAGRRVNLGEVAARIRSIPGVREVWVGMGEAAEPVLGAALATDLTLAAVKAALRVDTAPWKTPKRWAVLHEFPVTARGKPDTRALEASVFG
jgi:acyl-coenzyme A synthetase/AMP-(fatty) acid ligase